MKYKFTSMVVRKNLDTQEAQGVSVNFVVDRENIRYLPDNLRVWAEKVVSRNTEDYHVLGIPHTDADMDATVIACETPDHVPCVPCRQIIEKMASRMRLARSFLVECDEDPSVRYKPLVQGPTRYPHKDETTSPKLPSITDWHWVDGAIVIVKSDDDLQSIRSDAEAKGFVQSETQELHDGYRRITFMRAKKS